jgi:aspartate/methionine/tyrosine aminotransferase
MFWTKLLIGTGLARFLPGMRRRTGGAEAFLRYYSNRFLAAPHGELGAAAGVFEAPAEPDLIDLACAAPQFDMVPSASTKLPAGRRGYPPVWGLPELRVAVANHLEAQYQLAVSPEDEVLITHGAAGAFSVALDTFVNRGDPVVLFDPCSPLYSMSLRWRRARVRWLPVRVVEGCMRFRHDLLARALKGARLLVLNAPANPTGAGLAAADIEEIVWWAERHDVLIFCDQVYGRYLYEGEPLSVGTLVKGRCRTLTSGSVSTSYALTAARVGWLAGHRHLLRACALSGVLHSPFVPTLCQQIALTALTQPEESFAPVHADFASRRRYAYERLQALGLKPVWPAGGFFLWIPVRELGLSGRACTERLRRDHKVLVWPGEFFGPSGTDFIRLSFAGEDGRLREGLARVAELVRSCAAPVATPLKSAA